MKYTIKYGDTLGELALTFKTSVDEIMRVNNSIKNKHVIYKGQVIEIPCMCSHIRPVTSGGERPTLGREHSLSSLLNPDAYNSSNSYYFGNTEDACTKSAFELIQLISGTINNELNIVTRDNWGNYTPKYSAMELDITYSTAVIHHSGDGGSNNPSEIESKHMGKKGWNNVGYHYLITKNGSIYEGTKLGYKGIHVGGANTGKIGILIMGDYHHQFWDIDDDLSKVQLTVAVRLINVLAKRLNITELGGHRDYGTTKTVCPGDELYKKLDDLRSKTNLRKPN